MDKKRLLFSILAIWLAVISCNLPSSGTPATEVPTVTFTDTAPPALTATTTPIFTATASETPSPTSTLCKPTVTTNTVANVRSGPGQVYGVIGSIPQGGTANVAGKNFDGTWWYIEFAGGDGGFAWIAGSVTSAVCIPSTLASIVAPPTPIVPTAVPSSVPSATPVSGIILVTVPPILIYKSPTPVKLIPIIPVVTFIKP